MRRTLLLLAAAAALGLPASAEAKCYGVNDPIAPTTPPGHVCGTVHLNGYDGTYYVSRPAGGSYVKLCPAGSPSDSPYCAVTSTSTYSDPYGQPVQAWIFPHFGQGMTTTKYYDLYAWNDDFWGNPIHLLRRISVDKTGNEGTSLYMWPRPLAPTPVYPSGSSVPSSYTVRWKSGIDTDRLPYDVTYDVWYKYWPFGATEPGPWTPSRGGMPCQDDDSGPDGNNECSTYVAGPQPPGNWKWYVVANLYVNSNIIYSTKSSWISFTQPE